MLVKKGWGLVPKSLKFPVSQWPLGPGKWLSFWLAFVVKEYADCGMVCMCFIVFSLPTRVLMPRLE